MVTPASLNGAGCAAAGLAASADANNRAVNTVVFIDTSLLSRISHFGLPCEVNAISPREPGKASPRGIFPLCRSVARVERGETGGRNCHALNALPRFARL